MHPSKSTSRRHCYFLCCFIKNSSKLSSRLHERPEMRLWHFAKKAKFFIEKRSKSSSRPHESSIFAMLKVCKKKKKNIDFWIFAFYDGNMHISEARRLQNGKKEPLGGTLVPASHPAGLVSQEHGPGPPRARPLRPQNGPKMVPKMMSKMVPNWFNFVSKITQNSVQK